MDFPSSPPSVVYEAYVQNIGWSNSSSDGETAGIEGRLLRLEGIRIKLLDAPDGTKVRYRIYARNSGWCDWKNNGEPAVMPEQSAVIEAVKIELEGLKDYCIKYQVYIKGAGWQDWRFNGGTAGFIGQSSNLEAIRISIIKNSDIVLREDLDNTTATWNYIANSNQLPPAVNQKINIGRYNGYYVGDTRRKLIYLTFDGAFEMGYTNVILDVLKANEIKAAFFLTKLYLKRHRDLVKRMIREGHTIGNHTDSHLSMPVVANSVETFIREISEVEKVFCKLSKIELPRLLRLPSGEYSERTLFLANMLNYKIIFWSLAYDDYFVDNQPDNGYAFNRIISSIHNGAILRFHLISKTNVEILDSVIKEFKSKGYEFSGLNQI